MRAFFTTLAIATGLAGAVVAAAPAEAQPYRHGHGWDRGHHGPRHDRHWGRHDRRHDWRSHRRHHGYDRHHR